MGVPSTAYVCGVLVLLQGVVSTSLVCLDICVLQFCVIKDFQILGVFMMNEYLQRTNTFMKPVDLLVPLGVHTL